MCPLKASRFFSSAALHHTNHQWASQQLRYIPKNNHMKLFQSDGAGAAFDPFSISPFQALNTVFAQRGFQLTHAQITGPMGMKKEEHIRHLIYHELATLWKQKYKKTPDQSDVDVLHSEFTRSLQEIIVGYSAPTPHMVFALNFLKTHHILTALTTGYTRKMVEPVLVNLNDVLQFDATITSDEVKDGTRIAMIEENMRQLKIPPEDMEKVIFCTDASSDILNVRAAKNFPWIIGVNGFSTHVGIVNKSHLENISPNELLEKRRVAKNMLLKSGAHAVVRDMSELPLAIVAASRALSRGETPIQSNKLKIEEPSEKPFFEDESISLFQM